MADSAKDRSETSASPKEEETNDESTEYSVGDRVVLHGLVNAKQLNGRHGIIGGELDERTGRYSVDLDLLDPTYPKTSVKPVNLSREPPLDPSITRAQTVNGKLVETHGRDFSFILDVVRYLVGYLLMEDDDIRFFHDIQRIKDENMTRINLLSATAWSHWTHPGSFQGTDGRGVYQCLLEFLPQMFTAPSPESERLIRALNDPTAVGGWNVRIHGVFWVVGGDKDGTYLVPEEPKNHRAVYKVLGMSQALYPMVARTYPQGRPVKMRLTMLPWYGRLVYDGLVTPVDRFGEPGDAQVASETLARKLSRAVESAKEQGRVVERLIQLELPGGSREGIPSQGAASGTTAGRDQQQQDPATDQERRLVEAVNRMASCSLDDAARGWVFRRMDYTEDLNPDHRGVVLAGDAGMLGPFQCSALMPSSVDILEALVRYGDKQGFRPRVVAIDDEVCYERVKFLLADTSNLEVQYYMPPTPEEQAAIRANEVQAALRRNSL